MTTKTYTIDAVKLNPDGSFRVTIDGESFAFAGIGAASESVSIDKIMRELLMVHALLRYPTPTPNDLQALVGTTVTLDMAPDTLQRVTVADP